SLSNEKVGQERSASVGETETVEAAEGEVHEVGLFRMPLQMRLGIEVLEDFGTRSFRRGETMESCDRRSTDIFQYIFVGSRGRGDGGGKNFGFHAGSKLESSDDADIAPDFFCVEGDRRDPVK